MRVSKPFKESAAKFDATAKWRYELEGDPLDALTKYDYDNGRSVTVLRSVFGWEVWGSESGGLFGPSYFTDTPIVFDSEEKALAYRDALATADDPRALDIGDGVEMEDR